MDCRCSTIQKLHELQARGDAGRTGGRPGPQQDILLDMMQSKINSPEDGSLAALCEELRPLSNQLSGADDWPGSQLALCGEHGVYEWFFSPSVGGQGWSDADIFRGYLRLSAACLTTTFVITQRSGACRRIECGESDWARERYVADLLSGDCFATVGISHLTTSRRHLAKPALRATERAGGFVFEGFSPWVTGAPHADVVVTGATLDDDRQVLVALPMDARGISVPTPPQLVGLSASRTGPVEMSHVEVDSQWVLAGPVEGVMSRGTGGNTGGLQTSALAIGLTGAAIAFMEEESQKRADLAAPAAAFRQEWEGLRDNLIRLATGEPVCSNEVLRTSANSLVLRCTQAALAVAKGTGYLASHPAGRWCREALFFLVWSCPQPVLSANLCELAGIHE